ncbi:hypothetical protein EON63_08765 [archaeon]|nr:MAG: hypothetical protein EON63_08765 [archaeon]
MMTYDDDDDDDVWCMMYGAWCVYDVCSVYAVWCDVLVYGYSVGNLVRMYMYMCSCTPDKLEWPRHRPCPGLLIISGRLFAMCIHISILGVCMCIGMSQYLSVQTFPCMGFMLPRGGDIYNCVWFPCMFYGCVCICMYWSNVYVLVYVFGCMNIPDHAT